MTEKFYAEIWSCYANLIAVCNSKEELDNLVLELTKVGWNPADGVSGDVPEPWFVIDYNPDIDE